MAEAFAVVGIVSSIVQLVEFSSKLLNRLNEFQSSVADIPKTFLQIKTELPLLRDTLQQTKEAINAGRVNDDTTKALDPIIQGCREQIELLDATLVKSLPSPNDNPGKRRIKAILSIPQDAKVEKIVNTLNSYVRILTFYYAAASSTLKPLADEKLVEIRQWLAAPDPSINYQKALKQRQADTGLWFLGSEQYARWKSEGASFLWLYGIPGCGKTILSSSVLQNVFDYCENNPGKVVAYFYFDFNSPNKRNPEIMVRSLISQLSQQCVRVPSPLEALFSSCQKGARPALLDGYLQVLRHMIQEFPHTYIILDALDECADLIDLMDIVETIVEWGFKGLHILTTSRRERGVESRLECFVSKENMICLQSQLVDDDIKTYVRKRLSDDMSLKKWQKDKEMQQEIESALTKGAHGMFRWAACQLDTFGKCLSRSMLKKSLATLPPTLDETYERILCTIDKDYYEYAVRILQWLAFSQRPLLIEEISEVVAIETDRNPAFDRDQTLEDPLDVLNICSSLVTLATADEYDQIGLEHHSGPNGRVFLLAHFSVKEYLVSERCRQGRAALYSMQPTASNEFIAKSCLSYLLQFEDPDSFSIEQVKEFKLAEYAAEFWITHVHATQEKSNALIGLIMQLFSMDCGAFLNWIRIFDPDTSRMRFSDEKEWKLILPKLYCSSLCGLTEIAELLILDKTADVNAQGGLYGNALQAASVNGREKIVKLLLDNGADVNAQGGGYGNALQGASIGGNEKIVKQLLDTGANVNALGGHYGTALHAASFLGHEEVVELLLDNGAYVNAHSRCYGNALQAASSGGHEKIVEQLLNNGADVNAQGGFYGNALQAASFHGHEEVVELLLDNGAYINAQGGYYGNALQAASCCGHENIVKQLLNNGADVNAQGGAYSSTLRVALFRGIPLQHGAAEQDLEIAKLLYEAGADIKARSKTGETLLHDAAINGQLQVAQWLISHGLDPNAMDSAGQSPLHLAVQKKNHDIAAILLDNGASVNLADIIGRTPLHLAIYSGSDSAVRLLLSRNANVHLPDCYGKSSFEWVQLYHHLRESIGVFLTHPPYSELNSATYSLRRSVWILSSRLLDDDSQPIMPGYYELGHCLMYLGESAEALTAYEREILVSSIDSDVAHDVICDICQCNPIHNIRYVCTTCPDVDLCGNCQAMLGGNAIPKWCSGHDFMSIPGSTFGGRNFDIVNTLGETRIAWLKRIKDTFGMQPEEC